MPSRTGDFSCFCATCREAIERAGQELVADRGQHFAPLLLRSLFELEEVSARWPQLAIWLPPLPSRRSRGTSAIPALPDTVLTLFNSLVEQSTGGPISATALFAALLSSELGIQSLLWLQPAVGDAEIRAAIATPASWRESELRRQVMARLEPYGKMLTERSPASRGFAGMEADLERLAVALLQEKYHNVILTAPSGVGKSGLVKELARRIVGRHSALPPQLHDCDIFALDVVALKKLVGQGLDGAALLDGIVGTLLAHPQIFLFVDEAHHFLVWARSGHEPLAVLSAGVIDALDKITLIACAPTGEYEELLRSEPILARRITELPLEEPSVDSTLEILRTRVPLLRGQRMETARGVAGPHFAADDDVLRRIIEVADWLNPELRRPAKCIRLLEKIYAQRRAAAPLERAHTLTLTDVEEELSRAGGRAVRRLCRLNADEIEAGLATRVRGQAKALKRIAQKVAIGLSGMRSETGPRGLMVFAGPTGVGKTQTALTLAQLLDPVQPALLRVDCNTMLAGADDGMPVINRLIGATFGYLYCDKGGQLGAIAGNPECVVLFDEFDKAGPALFVFLQTLIDRGEIESNTLQKLDFRRAFIVLTTNAGAAYDAGPVVAGFAGQETGTSAGVTPEAVLDGLRRCGADEPFLGRISPHIVVFDALSEAVIEETIELQLRDLAARASSWRGVTLTWEPALPRQISARFSCAFGARLPGMMLEQVVISSLSSAESRGELRKGRAVRLIMGKPADGHAPEISSAAARSEPDILVISLPQIGADIRR